VQTNEKKTDASKLEWDIDVPIFGNRIVHLQLLLAFGIPIALIFIFINILKLIDWLKYGIRPISSSGAGYALLLIAILITLTVLLIFVLYKNRYQMHYLLNERGVRQVVRSEQVRKNAIINSLLWLGAILSRNAGAAGTAMLAGSRSEDFVSWERVKGYKVSAKDHTISLKVDGTLAFVLFCTPNIYLQAISYIQQKRGTTSSTKRSE